jgi:hypothetical protein
MSTRGDIIRGAGGHLKRNNDLGVGIGHPHGGDEGDIRVQMVDSSPHLYARAGGQWYGINLSTITDDTMRLGDSRDYLSINPDVGIELYNSHAKVATFGETTTVKDINITGKIGVTSASTRNVCIGSWSTGDPDVSGSVDNIAIGVDAGDKLESGAISNVLIGSYAGKLLATGYTNVLIGYKAGEVLLGGYANTCIGDRAGQAILGGFGHICIGLESGRLLESSNVGCVYIGNLATASGVSVSNEIVITGGTPTVATTGKGANTVLLGDDDVTDVYMGEDSQAKVNCNGVGIGGAASANELHISRDGGVTSNSSDIWLKSYNASASGGSSIHLTKTDNTIASPQAVGDNDILGTIHFDGYDGNGFAFGAAILARVDGTPDTNDMPTDLEFWTGTNIESLSKKAYVAHGGDFYTNDGSVSSISDVRVKKDIADLTDGLSIVNQLKPRTYKYNGKGEMGNDDGVTRYGFIADEVLSVTSNYVEVKSGMIDEEKVDDFKSLSMTRMIPMLVNAIQELSAKVTALEAQIN